MQNFIDKINKYTDKITMNVLLNSDDFNEFLIKPAQFGSIRGNKLNDIVYNRLCKLFKNVSRERQINDYPEKADIYIEDIKKVIYVQVDLWNGGEQINRLDKYSKLDSICICYYEYEIKNTNTKTDNLIKQMRNEHKLFWLSEINEDFKKYI